MLYNDILDEGGITNKGIIQNNDSYITFTIKKSYLQYLLFGIVFYLLNKG